MYEKNYHQPVEVGYAEQTRPTQIEMELAEMSGALENLRVNLAQLEGRLLPLLTESKPGPNNEKSINPPLVPLAAELRQRRAAIREMAGRVEEIMQRLEV